MAHELSKRGPGEKFRRFPGAPGHIRDCAGPGRALVGDAGYFKDPATAHGISDAFWDATRLSNVLAQGTWDASAYQIERDWIARPFFELTQKIASFDWDFDRLKALHMELYHHMKAELQALTPTPMAIAA